MTTRSVGRWDSDGSSAVTSRRLPTTWTRTRPSGVSTTPLARTMRPPMWRGSESSSASMPARSSGPSTGIVLVSCRSNSVGPGTRVASPARWPPSARNRPSAPGSRPPASTTGMPGASRSRCARADARRPRESARSAFVSTNRSASAIWRSTCVRIHSGIESSTSWSTAATTTTPSSRKPADDPHGITFAGSATPLSSTITCSGGSRTCSDLIERGTEPVDRRAAHAAVGQLDRVARTLADERPRRC